MRVVHLIGYFQPELGFREYYYSRHLARLGVDVHVVTSDRIWPYPNLAEIARAAGIPPTRMRPEGVRELDGFHVHRLPARFEYRDFIVVPGVRRKLEALQPDIVHAYEGRQGMPSVAARGRDPLPYRLYYEHEQRWTGVTFRARADHWLVRRHAIRPLVERADLVNVCTPMARRFLHEHFPASRGKTVEVPLGADPDLFSYLGDEERRRVRRRLGIRDEERLLITSGKILPHKRYDRLLREFFALGTGSPLVLLVLGSGDRKAEEALHVQAERSAAPGRRVIFEPFVRKERLSEYYSAADLGVWTGASITILEALACELPLALPASSSTDHLLDGNGVSFPEWGGFAGAVEPLLDDGAALAAARRRAGELFRERFDYRVIAAVIHRRYEDLLAGRPAADIR